MSASKIPRDRGAGRHARRLACRGAGRAAPRLRPEHHDGGRQAGRGSRRARRMREANNWNIAVAVDDTRGGLMYFERMEDTQNRKLDIAIMKAKAAATYRRTTRVFMEGINRTPATATLPGVVGSPGGDADLRVREGHRCGRGERGHRRPGRAVRQGRHRRLTVEQAGAGCRSAAGRRRPARSLRGGTGLCWVEKGAEARRGATASSLGRLDLFSQRRRRPLIGPACRDQKCAMRRYGLLVYGKYTAPRPRLAWRISGHGAGLVFRRADSSRRRSPPASAAAAHPQSSPAPAPYRPR